MKKSSQSSNESKFFSSLLQIICLINKRAKKLTDINTVTRDIT